MKNQFSDFVKSELSELESKDLDQLFECIKDNLEEMRVVFTDGLEAELYLEIETQLKKGK